MPRATTSPMLFYVYVLESDSDGKRYIGFTSNLRKRIEEHQRGKSFSTKYRLPMKIIYLEGCISEVDARRREKYLKSTRGNRFLVKRLIDYYKNKAKL